MEIWRISQRLFVAEGRSDEDELGAIFGMMISQGRPPIRIQNV